MPLIRVALLAGTSKWERAPLLSSIQSFQAHGKEVIWNVWNALQWMIAVDTLPGPAAPTGAGHVFSDHERELCFEVEEAFRPLCPPERVGTFESHPSHCTKGVDVGAASCRKGGIMRELRTHGPLGERNAFHTFGVDTWCAASQCVFLASPLSLLSTGSPSTSSGLPRCPPPLLRSRHASSPCSPGLQCLARTSNGWCPSK